MLFEAECQRAQAPPKRRPQDIPRRPKTAPRSSKIVPRWPLVVSAWLRLSSFSVLFSLLLPSLTSLSALVWNFDGNKVFRLLEV